MELGPREGAHRLTSGSLASRLLSATGDAILQLPDPGMSHRVGLAKRTDLDESPWGCEFTKNFPQ